MKVLKEFVTRRHYSMLQRIVKWLVAAVNHAAAIMIKDIAFIPILNWLQLTGKHFMIESRFLSMMARTLLRWT